MRTALHGWKILCPDGKERHYPYINYGDAECDARIYDERGGCQPDPDILEREGPCPKVGRHDVVACVYTPPAPPGEA